MNSIHPMRTGAKQRMRVTLAALLAAPSLWAQSIPPVPLPGPHPVGCSNIEQDFARLPPGEAAESYWRGLTTEGNERYVTALLTQPENALIATFVAPDDPELYARWSGRTLTYALLVCYPTAASNTRADYVMPHHDHVVPRMQRGAEAPILPAGGGRWPVLVVSHGYAGSPLSGNYLPAQLAWSSHGYITVAPFHGDLRYSVFGPQDGDPPPGYVPVWSEFVAMQATRARSVSAALDLVGSHPQWAAYADMGRVGGFGTSQGGETLMLAGGAALTYSLLQESRVVGGDSRLKASVGYIPYFGLEDVPAFGRDQQGAASATVPFFAISGTEDELASIDVVLGVLDKTSFSRGVVALAGQHHDPDPASGGDIYTWGLTFLAAYVEGDAAARTTLASAQSVAGGLDDSKVSYVEMPPRTDVRDTIEHYHDALDHYFITADPAETATLDEGTTITGWRRTGFVFKTWPLDGPGVPACRFAGTPGIGPSSHFYTIDPNECELVKSDPQWTFEGLVFNVMPVGSGCAADQRPVIRLYNDGMGGQANHRYVTDDAQVRRMTGLGWLIEGPVFCVPR